MDRSRQRIWRKARQIGGSTAIAAECAIEAAVKGVDCLICSASEKNAQEVLSKCRGFIEVARAAGLSIKITTDSRSELAFSNGHKILSLPQNPDTIRGFSGHLYLDEFAHHGQDREIYAAGFPVTTRGFRFSVVSTPMGQSGEYYRCWTERPDFSKHDTSISDAVRMGLGIDVEPLRRNMDPDAFRQEYLCEFIDEATAYFPYDLIRRAIGECPVERGDVCIGVDIGRKHDLTVVYALGQLNDMAYTVDIETLSNQPFETQRLAVVNTVSRYGARRMAVDSTGIGAQLAEQLTEDLPGVDVESVVFTNDSKRDMAVAVKRAMETGKLQIPDDGKLIGDIHAIRRSVSPSNNIRFDAERTAEGHADRFWALALALRAAQNTSGFQVLFEC